MAIRKEYNQSWNPFWLNMPDAGTDDYDDLKNRPSINSNLLEGNKTGGQLGLGDAKLSDLAPAFSDATNYEAGDMVINDGKFCYFPIDHSAGALQPGELVETNVAEQIFMHSAAGGGDVAKLSAGNFISTITALVAAMEAGDTKKIYAEYIDFPMYVDGEHSGHPQGYSLGVTDVYIGGYDTINRDEKDYVRFSVATQKSDGNYAGVYFHVVTTNTDGTGTQVRLRKPVITIAKGAENTSVTMVYEGLSFVAKSTLDIKKGTGTFNKASSTTYGQTPYYEVVSAKAEDQYVTPVIDVDGICRKENMNRTTDPFTTTFTIANDGTNFTVSTSDIYRFQFNKDSLWCVNEDVVKLILDKFNGDFEGLMITTNVVLIANKTIDFNAYLAPFMKIGDGIVV